MENNDSKGISPKRPNITDEATDEEMIIDDMIQSPGWTDEYLITATPPIENHFEKLKEIINMKTTPTTPNRQTRSHEKDTPARSEQNHKNSRTRSQDIKDKSINKEKITNISENKKSNASIHQYQHRSPHRCRTCTHIDIDEVSIS